MPPLVSVIVPLYNGSPFIRQALESLIGSSYASWEAVVVDDGSTDGGGLLVEELARRDRRVRLVTQENRGLGAARNTGLEHARGELVAFLDADDLWFPAKLERQVAAWCEGIIYSDAYLMAGPTPGPDRIGAHITFVRGQIFDDLLAENRVAVLTALLSRADLEDAGGFDATLPQGCEDYDLWLRLAARGRPFDFVDEPLAAYRVHAEAMSQSSVNMTRSRVAVFERLAEAAPEGKRPAVERRLAEERRALGGALRQRAWRRSLDGDEADAVGDLREAQIVAPTLAGRIGVAAGSRSAVALRAIARRRVGSPST